MPRRRLGITVGLAMLLLAAQAGAAEEPAQKPSWTDKLRFSGDVRFRYEGFDWDGQYDDGRRDRFRYRYRLGLEARISERLHVGASVRSGETRDPVSDNRSFGEGFDKGLVSLAEIYARYQVNDGIRISLGKFAPEKLWRVSDLEWDDDVNVEGAMEEFDWKLGGVVEKLELNVFQFIGVERSSAADSYLLGAQLAPVFRLGESNQLVAGVGYEHWTEPDAIAALSDPYVTTVDPDDTPVLDGNDMTNLVQVDGNGDLVLVSDFHIASAFAIWKNTAFERWPLQVQLFYYQNLGAEDIAGQELLYGGTGTGSENDTAYFARLQVGESKQPGQWSFRLTRAVSDPDAVLYVFANSDTGRGSNHEGYRADVRVGLPKSSYLNLTYYNNEPRLGEDPTLHRWQLDWQISF